MWARRPVRSFASLRSKTDVYVAGCSQRFVVARFMALRRIPFEWYSKGCWHGVSTVKGICKCGFVGCLGAVGAVFVLLLVVIVVIALAVGSTEDDDGIPGQVGTNSGDEHVSLAVGTLGEIFPDGNSGKRSRITILQIDDQVESDNAFSQPSDGKKWWWVEIEVENVGTKEVTSPTWKLRDSDDGEHDEAFVVGAGEPLDVLFDLTPGGKTKGWIFFEIPEGVSAKWLRAGPNFLLKNDLYFDSE